MQRREGDIWNQKILVHGDLGRTIKMTQGGKGRATPERYRDFTLKRVEIFFPLSRWISAADDVGIAAFLAMLFKTSPDM
jgi:hypothetical protein